MMTRPHASLTHPAPWPSPQAIPIDRIARLRARIEAGRYAVQPHLVAEAILASDANDGVNCLTPEPRTASTD